MSGKPLTDAEVVAELEKVCDLMSLEQLRRFCEGSLRASAVSQRVLVKKWPDEWRKFDEDVEAGRVML